MDKHIEVLLATIGQRRSIKEQIESIRSQSYQNFRLNILADGNYDSVRALAGELRENERIIEIPNGPRGNVGHPAVRWTIENVEDLHGWVFICGDDDITYPNAYQKFADAMDDCSMVVGVVNAVTRNASKQHIKYLGNEQIAVCHVTGSCCIYRLEDMKQLEAPCYSDATYDSDWTLIRRMIERFKYKRIPDIVYRLDFP